MLEFVNFTVKSHPGAPGAEAKKRVRSQAMRDFRRRQRAEREANKLYATPPLSDSNGSMQSTLPIPNERPMLDPSKELEKLFYLPQEDLPPLTTLPGTAWPFQDLDFDYFSQIPHQEFIDPALMLSQSKMMETLTPLPQSSKFCTPLCPALDPTLSSTSSRPKRKRATGESSETCKAVKAGPTYEKGSVQVAFTKTPNTRSTEATDPFSSAPQPSQMLRL